MPGIQRVYISMYAWHAYDTMNVRGFFQQYWPLIILLGIGIIVCATNYTPHTFLSGWDTLHPEFNIPLNLSRAFFGVFEPQAGLGAVSAHSHAADLPHILFVGLLSLLFPLSFIRYLFIFLCFLLGPAGMYVFLSHLFPGKKTAFAGALFYMLNIGTVQMFFVPFEMFTIQYAILPWLFFFATDFFVTKSKKSYVGFLAITLFSSPIAYAATLWYVTFIVFSSFLVTYFFLTRRTSEIRTIFLLLGGFVVCNLYWILPNLYVILLYGKTVTQAASNQLFSQEAFLYNKAFGNFKDIVFLHIFYFGWSVYSNHAFDSLMQPWISYLANPSMLFLSVFFAFLAGTGVLVTLYKRQTILLAFIPGLVISFIFLINDNLPFHAYQLLDAVPFFQEAFRFPDDKILGIYLFLYSLFLSLGIYTISQIVKSKLTSVLILHTAYYVLITASILFLSFPIFTGNLISPTMRIHIPANYFQLFSYLSHKPNGRIATFPIDSLWGWEYYQWPGQQQSFQGSGFLWFGTQQPLMDRNYDRWNSSNEAYYREMSYAVYSQNQTLFDEVLKKYDISYIILDKSIIAPGYNSRMLWYPYLTKLLTTDKRLKHMVTFGNDLSVYQTQFPVNKQILSFQNNLPIVTMPITDNFEDIIYHTYGDYISGLTSSTLNYPFINITDNLGRVNENLFSLGTRSIQLVAASSLSSFVVPSFLAKEQLIPATAYLRENKKIATISLHPFTPVQKAVNPISVHFILPNTSQPLILSLNTQQAISFLPSTQTQNFPLGTVWLRTSDNTIGLFQTDNAISLPIDFTQKNLTIQPCLHQNTNNIFGIQTRSVHSISLFGEKTFLCASLPLPSISKDKLVSKNSLLLLTGSYAYQGSPLSSICLINSATKSCLPTALTKIGTNAPNFISFLTANDTDSNLQIIFDTSTSKTFQTATYSHLSMQIQTPYAVKKISQTTLAQLFPEKKYTEPIQLPLYPVYPQTNLATTDGSDCPYNPFLPVPNTKKVIKKTGNYVEYTSFDGSFCDHMSFTKLVPQQSYLLDIQSRNKTGLPLTVCVSEPTTGRCGVYTKLPAKKNFTDTFILVPPLPQTNLDVNIDNLGIAPTTSINDIASITMTPFPANWLSDIHTSTSIPQEGMRQPLTFHNLFNDSVYTTTFQHQSTDVLRLSQSYDPGFVLFALPSSTPSFLAVTLPFLFGKMIGKHVLVDSWANGWVLPSLPTTHFVVIFLPQYLEYVGLLAGFIFVGIVFWIQKRSKRTNK